MNNTSMNINCVVRVDSNNELNLFYYDERKDLVTFTLSEGHSNACLEYMYSCKPCTDNEAAQSMVDRYNSIGDDSVVFKLKKRLSRHN